MQNSKGRGMLGCMSLRKVISPSSLNLSCNKDIEEGEHNGIAIHGRQQISNLYEHKLKREQFPLKEIQGIQFQIL